MNGTARQQLTTKTILIFSDTSIQKPKIKKVHQLSFEMPNFYNKKHKNNQSRNG